MAVWALSLVAIVAATGCADGGVVEDVAVQPSPTVTPESRIEPTPTPRATARPTPVPTGRPGPAPSPATMTPAPSPSTTSTPAPTPTAPTATLSIAGIDFDVEVVVTAAERVRGLSGRESLPPNSGMLFVYAPGMVPAFWMKEMLIPLDFVWIGEGCEVVDIAADVPAPASGAPNSELLLYRPSVAATYTFEINAGEAERRGIQVGDKVRFSGVAELFSGAEC